MSTDNTDSNWDSLMIKSPVTHSDTLTMCQTRQFKAIMHVGAEIHPFCLLYYTTQVYRLWKWELVMSLKSFTSGAAGYCIFITARLDTSNSLSTNLCKARLPTDVPECSCAADDQGKRKKLNTGLNSRFRHLCTFVIRSTCRPLRSCVHCPPTIHIIWLKSKFDWEFELDVYISAAFPISNRLQLRLVTLRHPGTLSLKYQAQCYGDEKVPPGWSRSGQHAN